MAKVRWVLVRHAPARPRDFARWPDDQGRPLKATGRKEFRLAAAGITRMLAEEGAIATSPLARASQTADLLRERWEVTPAPEVWEELLPDAEPAKLFARARAVSEGGDLVLVGHEPALSRFVGYCLFAQTQGVLRFSKGGAVALDFPGGTRPGTARLLWAMTRGQLRRQAPKRSRASPRARGRSPVRGRSR